MNKITIIHNLYRRNPWIAESIELNIKALCDAKVPFQYIAMNDNGDKEVYDDLLSTIEKIKSYYITNPEEQSFEYIYSNVNFGKRMCTGCWVGAIPYIKGTYIHNVAQDDVMSSQFYLRAYFILEKYNDIYAYTANGIRTNEYLIPDSFLNSPNFEGEIYLHPDEAFDSWFNVKDGIITTANNGFCAPGTIYKKILHDLIGLPDIENFRGACDFEYWARILYNGYKVKYDKSPNWLYRNTQYTAGNEIIDGKPNRGYWQQLHIEAIKEKYQKLINEG